MTGNAEIVLKRGPGAGRAFALHGESLVLGRDPRSDVVIDHPQVSRRHARITRRDDQWLIEDLDSTNGTFLNGSYLAKPETLSEGDAIGLSDAVTLIYRVTARASDRPRRPPSGPPAPPGPGHDEAPPRRTYPGQAAPRRFDSPGPPPPAYDQRSGRDPYRTWLWIAIGCAVTLLVLASVAVVLLYVLRAFAPFVF